jgi:hypothetical protein
MATRIHFPELPASVAALPFLFMRARAGDRDWDFNAALAFAVAAERADSERRNTRRRLAYLLCELGYQYGRRTGDYGQAMPLSRSELARALGVSLPRVKRILALLSLSQVIDCASGASIRVTDWPRLCGVAAYDCARLGVEMPEEFTSPFADEEDEPPHLTAAGDQACFV